MRPAPRAWRPRCWRSYWPSSRPCPSGGRGRTEGRPDRRPGGRGHGPLPGAGGRRRPRLARSYTPNVVKVYSPDATWTAVEGALQGASVVVYLGHGNGWPSRYRDALPIDPERVGAEPQRRAPTPTSTSARSGSARSRAREERGRDLQPPLLRERQHGARPARGHARAGQQRVDNYAAGFFRAGAARSSPRPTWGPRTTSGGSSAATADRPDLAGTHQPGRPVPAFASSAPRAPGPMDPDTRRPGLPPLDRLPRRGSVPGRSARPRPRDLPASPGPPTLIGSGLCPRHRQAAHAKGATPRRRRRGVVVPVRGEGGGRPRWPDRRRPLGPAGRGGRAGTGAGGRHRGGVVRGGATRHGPG